MQTIESNAVSKKITAVCLIFPPNQADKTLTSIKLFESPVWNFIAWSHFYWFLHQGSIYVSQTFLVYMYVSFVNYQTMFAGLKTGLVEKLDFSAGTSSRSTKLIHGGVRYLQKAVFNLDIEQVEIVPSHKWIFFLAVLNSHVMRLLLTWWQETLVHAPKLWVEEISKRALLFPLTKGVFF